MKNKPFILALLVIAVLLFAGFAQTSKPQYEYKFENNISEQKANELGAQGWELVAAPTVISGGMHNVVAYVFKRAR
jgi:hypothetical protein